jgi:hypothetical protein
MTTPLLEKILAAKAERRRRLAAAPMPEKIQALVRLQEMAAPILRARGRAVRPWQPRGPAPERRRET